jgi:hypothetical protein
VHLRAVRCKRQGIGSVGGAAHAEECAVHRPIIQAVSTLWLGVLSFKQCVRLLSCYPEASDVRKTYGLVPGIVTAFHKRKPSPLTATWGRLKPC